VAKVVVIAAKVNCDVGVGKSFLKTGLLLTLPLSNRTFLASLKALLGRSKGLTSVTTPTPPRFLTGRLAIVLYS